MQDFLNSQELMSVYMLLDQSLPLLGSNAGVVKLGVERNGGIVDSLQGYMIYYERKGSLCRSPTSIGLLLMQNSSLLVNHQNC